MSGASCRNKDRVKVLCFSWLRRVPDAKASATQVATYRKKRPDTRGASSSPIKLILRMQNLHYSVLLNKKTKKKAPSQVSHITLKISISAPSTPEPRRGWKGDFPPMHNRFALEAFGMVAFQIRWKRLYFHFPISSFFRCSSNSSRCDWWRCLICFPCFTRKNIPPATKKAT